MKEKITFDIIGGTILGILSWFFGSIDQVFITFIFFMIIDYFTGMVAAIVNAKLESHKGWRGILKKTASLFLVAVIYRADVILPTMNGWESPLRDILIYALAINDLISIVENLGEWGLKIPKFISDRLAKLKNQE